MYGDQVVGYLHEITYLDNGLIDSAIFYLFYCKLFDRIRQDILKGSFMTFDKEPDIENPFKNSLYDITLNGDKMVLSRKNKPK